MKLWKIYVVEEKYGTVYVIAPTREEAIDKMLAKAHMPFTVESCEEIPSGVVFAFE